MPSLTAFTRVPAVPLRGRSGRARCASAPARRNAASAALRLASSERALLASSSKPFSSSCEDVAVAVQQ
eukprot:CAMPEP_0115871370 /NCGR_PEP_ID=MMETSP0287-20121206/22832_1 /TAXON_ID=412157 /ORGANISM="Chrysochromulina rotalis, Strain UIO044" /LENGTH=68 /DNA_ID=CAMNT_0003326171 /DNA_START=309 /DNA_END=512 /DNA_ORIENTATION=-